VFYKWQKLLTLHEHLGLPPVFFGGCSSFEFPVLCWFFVVVMFVLCLVCPMLPVFLDCPFLTVPSAFSNVYIAFILYHFQFLTKRLSPLQMGSR
jgi:hypothetical protein